MGDVTYSLSLSDIEARGSLIRRLGVLTNNSTAAPGISSTPAGSER